ncbi:alkaline phosphatase family protein [Nocardioides speluncae]|uniref:alkaline phosphatase family protein n=1 Tax=Nocardioides speluncae TaxID=2670337 RepID=UPI000D697F20|nr:alkaline phosphatase family protein [Nocardioides speluncae]
MPTSTRFWRATVAVTAAGLVAGVGLLPGQVGAAAPEANTKHVLVIGVDGLNWSRVGAAKAPTLMQLTAEGTLGQSLLYAGPMAATSSGPGWSTLLTGTWPDQHGVRDNSFAGSQLSQHPDFLTRLERNRPAADTWAGVDWKAIDDHILSDEIDTKFVRDGDATGYVQNDLAIADNASAHLRTAQADATFAYFGQQDIVGHSYGAASKRYLNEIAVVDGHVKKLLDAIAARPNRANENWLVLMGTDHGHTDGGGHGGNTLPERGTFVLAWGDGVPAAVNNTSRLPDLAASALGHLGVPTQADADGRLITYADTDPFESKRPALKSATTEPIPSTIKGWTQELPAGWSQDIAMTATGVPEWRGWTMTTDAFWAQAQRGQNRELFVRGRGVMAVADSDEWADATSSTGVRFDATLWTPSVSVAAKRWLDVDLTHYYRQDGDSIANVVVRFDGGAATVVKAFTGETSGRRETVRITVPAGAQNARVGFRHAGTNAWYWAVDDVVLRPVS